MSATMQSPKILLGGSSQVIGQNVTAQAISNPATLNAKSAMEGFAIEIVAASVTVTNAISAKVQHSFDGGTTWDDIDATNAKVAISGNGRFRIPVSPWNTSLAAKFPVRGLLQVVITTGASDAATITDIRLTQAF